MATAHDGAGTWVLFANAGGVRVGRRSSTGVYSEPILVDDKGLGGASFPTGDLLVAGGRWLAVWSRQVGPGGEFAQTELFSAQTLGQGHCFSAGLHKQRLTRSSFNDDAPTLAPIGDDDGTPRLVWERNDGAQGASSDLRAGRQPFDDCLWRHQRYTSYGDLNTEPDATRGLESRLLTWRRDGEILVDGGSAFSRRVLGRGFSPGISHTGASTHVAWVTLGTHVQASPSARRRATPGRRRT